MWSPVGAGLFLLAATIQVAVQRPRANRPGSSSTDDPTTLIVANAAVHGALRPAIWGRQGLIHPPWASVVRYGAGLRRGRWAS